MNILRLNKHFKQACDRGAEVLKSVTPVDAQRLAETTRTVVASDTKTLTEIHIVQGGESRFGIRKEQGIEREVGYAKYVILNNNYVHANIKQIKQEIVRSLCSK